jgi:hypothetical protein
LDRDLTSPEERVSKRVAADVKRLILDFQAAIFRRNLSLVTSAATREWNSKTRSKHVHLFEIRSFIPTVFHGFCLVDTCRAPNAMLPATPATIPPRSERMILKPFVNPTRNR